MATKKSYRLTASAPIELRRQAVNGEIVLSERAAYYEILRGTVEPIAAAKPASK